MAVVDNSTQFGPLTLSQSFSLLVGKVQGINLEVVIAVGHTDSVGTDEYNQGLSERRSRIVYDYLTGHGVDAGRVLAQPGMHVGRLRGSNGAA